MQGAAGFPRDGVCRTRRGWGVFPGMGSAAPGEDGVCSQVWGLPHLEWAVFLNMGSAAPRMGYQGWGLPHTAWCTCVPRNGVCLTQHGVCSQGWGLHGVCSQGWGLPHPVWGVFPVCPAHYGVCSQGRGLPHPQHGVCSQGWGLPHPAWCVFPETP